MIHLITKLQPNFIVKVEARIRFRALKKSGLVQVGEGTYGDPIVHWWNQSSKVVIGKYCSIADGVVFILGGEHRTEWKSTYPFYAFPKKWKNPELKLISPATKGDINIENDVWIGYGAIVLSGVRIGNGAVIGAGSVVTKDVAPYSVTAGNPAKHIRWRFPESTIKLLLEEQWWNWPRYKIVENVKTLVSVPAFSKGKENT